MYDFFYAHAYAVGGLILFVAWLPFYIKRRDLRKEIIFAGLLGLFLSFTNKLWVPYYWSPDFLFNLMNRVGFSIEDLAFGFFAGGIAAVIYEEVESKKLIKIERRKGIHLSALAILVVTYFTLAMIFPEKILLDWFIAAVMGSIFVSIIRHDLIKQILVSGVLFALIYFVLFQIFMAIFPGWLQTFYNLNNFWGIFVVGIPLEEIAFAFSTGLLWSVIYEFTMGYKTAKIRK